MSSSNCKWAPAATLACPGHDSKRPQLIRNEVCIMPSAKHSKTEVLAGSEGNLEWVEEEKDDGYRLQ